MDFTSVTACRACGGADLAQVLDLGRQPLANSYVREPVEQPTYPLELLVCQRCWLSQLSVVVNPELMFRDYLYVSGTSRTLRAHFAGLAGQALEWVGRRPARVLDLACNDGTLLEAFRREGCEVRGVDPARNLVALARQKGLSVVEGYWPTARAELDGTFDVVTACNVLAHVADPRAFLRAALDCLAPGGAVVVEFPYARALVLHGEWDTIYHEHLSYFLVGPLLALAESLGAAVTHAEAVPIHGGSLRLAIQTVKTGHCPEAVRMAEADTRDGLTRLETYQRLARHTDTVCADLRAAVAGQMAAGRTVVGFGASAKGNTLLNRCQLPLAYIVDDSPLKHGYRTPGRHVLIRPPTVLAQESHELAIVLLAWNFATEIIGNVRALRPSQTDQVIHYVPGVQVRNLAAPGSTTSAD